MIHTRKSTYRVGARCEKWGRSPWRRESQQRAVERLWVDVVNGVSAAERAGQLCEQSRENGGGRNAAEDLSSEQTPWKQGLGHYFSVILLLFDTSWDNSANLVFIDQIKTCTCVCVLCKSPSTILRLYCDHGNCWRQFLLSSKWIVK